MGHVLLIGPPGMGKKTLASIIAKELGVGYTAVARGALKKNLDFTGILSNIRSKQVLLVEALNELPTPLKQMLASTLADFRVEIIVGVGPGARLHTLPMPRFTLVGTTRTPRISGIPLERFGLTLTLNDYTEEDMTLIVLRLAKKLELTVDDSAANEIARRANGTPGNVVGLLRRVRDYAEVRSDGNITATVAAMALI